MLFAHLVVAGFVEAALTIGVVTYLQRANLPILRINHPGVPASADELAAPRRLGYRWAFVGLAVMAVLSPLGLLAPGGAFGEDAPVDLNLHRYHLNAVPQGLADYNGFWHHTVLGGYGFAGGSHEYLGYILSALVGMAAIALVIVVIVAVTRRVSGSDRLRPEAV
jgi:cobalt/nickel transport system permease protein